MIKDLTGKRFGRLTVIKHVGSSRNYKALWLCRCDCGNEKVVLSGCLINGDTKSCGCLNTERITKHGNSRTRLYRTWQDIKQRCLNPKNVNYHNYGGRGICIAPEWLDFVTFLNWAEENGYCEDLTIERIDNNGDYSPDNSTFITIGEQQSNKRTNMRICYKGESGTLSQIIEKHNLNQSTVRGRIREGWSVNDALTKPVKKHRRSNKRILQEQDPSDRLKY